MELEKINSEEAVLRYIEGCLNDFETGISSKEETEKLICDLCLHLIKLDRVMLKRNQLKEK